MKCFRKLVALFCALILILDIESFAFAAQEKYFGYSVIHWSGTDYYGDTTDYYTVYHNFYEENGTPTFYCEQRDHYINIYTGMDVEITFFRWYDSATVNQAEAFCEYLIANSREKYKSAGYYFNKLDGEHISSLFVWFFEGWDVENSELDMQDLWDRNIWMNCDATGLILEYLGYGRSPENWQYGQKLGCSSAIYVQQSPQYGFPGIAIGFHFIEGTDDHAVKRYCENETW